MEETERQGSIVLSSHSFVCYFPLLSLSWVDRGVKAVDALKALWTHNLISENSEAKAPFGAQPESALQRKDGKKFIYVNYICVMTKRSTGLRHFLYRRDVGSMAANKRTLRRAPSDTLSTFFCCRSVPYGEWIERQLEHTKNREGRELSEVKQTFTHSQNASLPANNKE